jgi:hypothetical protein
VSQFPSAGIEPLILIVWPYVVTFFSSKTTDTEFGVVHVVLLLVVEVDRVVPPV